MLFFDNLPIIAIKSNGVLLKCLKNAAAELDFVAEFDNKVIPIEVKSGKTGTLKSLHIYMAEKKLKNALRFNTDLPSLTLVSANVTVGSKVQNVNYNLISLPLYMVLESKRLAGQLT